MKREKWAARLAELEAEAARIRSEGDCLQDCWLERTAAGGTATGMGTQAGRYATLRSRSLIFPSGRRSRYVPLDEVAQVAEAIERGRRLAAVERAIAATVKKLDR